MNKSLYPRSGRVSEIDLKDFQPVRAGIVTNGAVSAKMRMTPTGSVWCLDDDTYFGTGRTPEHAFQNYQCRCIQAEAERRMKTPRAVTKKSAPTMAERMKRIDDEIRREKRISDRVRLEKEIAQYVRSPYDSNTYEIFDVYPVDECDAVIVFSARRPQEKPWCVRYLGSDEEFPTIQEAMNYARSFLPSQR